MIDVKPQGFVLLALCLFTMVAAVLSLIEPPVRLAKSPEELRAARAAAHYLASQPAYRYASDRAPGVFEKWGSWVVTFPPTCSLTGNAGPKVVLTQATFRVTKVSVSDGVCVDETPWWQRPDRER